MSIRVERKPQTSIRLGRLDESLEAACIDNPMIYTYRVDPDVNGVTVRVRLVGGIDRSPRHVPLGGDSIVHLGAKAERIVASIVEGTEEVEDDDDE